MECEVVNVEVKRGEKIYIEPLGDIHYGHPACDLKRLRSRVNAIRDDPHRYWIGMGDYIENIRPYRPGRVDMRWNTEILKGEPDWDLQIRGIVEELKPIAHKCFGLLWGNHEWANMTGMEFEDRLCNPLGAKFLGSSAFILMRILCDKKLVGEYVIFATHGNYSGSKVGGAINRMQDLSSVYDADIYLMGHVHTKAIHRDEKISVGVVRGKPVVMKRTVIYGLTGCFLNSYQKGVETYVDRKPMLRNFKMGTITIGIDPWEGKLHGYD